MCLREQSNTGLGLRKVCSCWFPCGFTLALGDKGQELHRCSKNSGTSSRTERTEVFLQRNNPQPWVTQVSKVRSTTILAISTHRAHNLTRSLAFPWFVPLVLGNPVSTSGRSKPGWGTQSCLRGMRGYWGAGNPALTSEESAYWATRAHWKRSWALGTHEAKPSLRKHLVSSWGGLHGPHVH